VLVVSGEMFAYGMIGWTALCVLYYGTALVLPAVIAVSIAYRYARGRGRLSRR
jgi:hypothetical protein